MAFCPNNAAAPVGYFVATVAGGLLSRDFACVLSRTFVASWSTCSFLVYNSGRACEVVKDVRTAVIGAVWFWSALSSCDYIFYLRSTTENGGN